MTPEKFSEVTADIPPETIEKLRVDHRRLYFVTEQPDIAFKPPTKAQWRRFMDLLFEKRNSEALEVLTFDCVVHPPMPELKALIEDYPGLPAEITAAIREVASREAGTAAKKLEAPTSLLNVT